MSDTRNDLVNYTIEENQFISSSIDPAHGSSNRSANGTIVFTLLHCKEQRTDKINWRIIASGSITLSTAVSIRC